MTQAMSKTVSFLHDGDEWEVFFTTTENGHMPVVSNGVTIKVIPLILNDRDVDRTMIKLNSLGKCLDGISFGLFRDIIAGAASLSMKYG